MEEQAPISINYSQYYEQTTTSSELRRRKEEENRKQILENMMYASGAAGAGFAGYQYAKNNDTILRMAEKLPGAGILDSRMSASPVDGIYNTARDASSPQPLSRSLHSMLLAAEETTPLHIAKTLGMSSFQTLFVEVVDQEKRSVKIGSDSIKAYSQYYRNLVLNSSGYKLTKLDMENGFILEDDKLFLANKNGSKGREILGYARAISTNTPIGEQDSPNRVFQKFANVHGVQVHVSQAKAEPIAIVGGSSKSSTMGDWMRAYGRFSTEIGFKVLDNPFGFVEEMAGSVGYNVKDSALFNSKAFGFMKKHFDLGLGANGDYTVGNRAATMAMAKNLAWKATGAYTTYVSANWLLEKITGEDNPWHNGVGAGLADTYAKLRVGMAKLWSDPLQDIRTEQEEAAQGSTSLSTLIGLPLGGAMLGATLAYGKRMRDMATQGYDESARLNTEIRKVDGKVGDLLDKIKMNPQGTTLSRYAKVGGLVGAALAVPFLPGVLVGRSSEELKAEYSGSADVAVRRNRFWLFGSESYEGGQTKYFRKSLVKEISSDARNKTLYESGEQQRDMDPIYSPFKYLKNPYAFEEAHKDDMPYPVWGMEVTYGSFLGKLFQGTVGQVIKPTVVNPEFLAQVEREKQAATSAPLIQAQGGSVVGSGEIQSTTASQELGKAVDPDIEVTVKESRKDVSMQRDGMMLAKPSATVAPTEEAARGAYAAFSDFTGLKGFTSGLVLDSMGLDLAGQDAPKLAVSGSANTLVDRYQDMQLGDAMGCFVPDTFVFTEDGFVRIKHIQVGDRVVSRGGKLRVVSKIFSKEYNQEILKITLSDDSVIYTTMNHIFPGMEYISGDVQERNIVDWEEGDFLFKHDTERYDPDMLPYGSQLLSIEQKEVVWYKGLMYDLEVSEELSGAPSEYTNYYTVEGALCHNSGEFIRRLIPQSADTRRETINTMKNNVAPSWLPRDTHRNYGEGVYVDKHEAGYTMLPGTRGFDELHPELRGIDPENYSDAWKYKILQNVARGSREHYAYRDRLIENLDTLSEADRDVFFSAYEQDMERGVEKRFSEYKTAEDKKGFNPLQIVQNTIWENVSHIEPPTEMLTPLRPTGKFLHQRTAIEDYQRTQLGGSDAAIWTKPMEHFIRPTINKSIHLFNEGYKPRDVEEKEAIDEYFDNLKLVKSEKGRPIDAPATVVSAAYSGMRTEEDMRAFRRALPKNQTAYVESFATEKDEDKRAQILDMLPKNIARVYTQIWENLDTYDVAVASGGDGNKAVRDLYLRETETLKRETGIQLTSNEVAGIHKEAYKIEDRQAREDYIAERQAAKIRAKAAQQEAQAYVEQTTGTPSDTWIGWDSRLTTDDIKLRALSVGGEDIHRYGFWNKDVQRNERIIALDTEDEVTTKIKSIKKRLREEQDQKHLIKNRLRERGYNVKNIETAPGSGNVNINTNTEGGV